MKQLRELALIAAAIINSMIFVSVMIAAITRPNFTVLPARQYAEQMSSGAIIVMTLYLLAQAIVAWIGLTDPK